MNIKGKKVVAVLGAICILNLMAAGCSASSVSTVQTDEEAAKMPDEVQTENETETKETQENKTAGTNDGQTDDPETAGSDTVSDGAAQASDPRTDEAEKEAGNAEGRWHVLDPETAAVVDADFEGTVYKTGTDSFYITECTTEILEDGVLLGVGIPSEADIPDSELIQVVFEEGARFYIRTIYDNGARYEDSEAGFKDLQQNMSVGLKGEFVGDVFHADEIRMVRLA